MVVLNKRAIAVRDRMYRLMVVMAPELKNGFPARTRWDKKLEQVLLAALNEPLTDEEYYKILSERVDRIMYELKHGERRPW